MSSRQHTTIATFVTIATLAAVLAGVALRAALLPTREPWLDEACTAMLAGQDLPSLWASLVQHEAHPPLYYLAMMAWTALAGASEVALRLPSLLAGVATIGVGAHLARRLGGAWAGAAAAWLLATSPLLTYYGVEARPYGWAGALLLAALAALDRAIAPAAEAAHAAATGSATAPPRGAWLASGLLFGAATLCHFTVVLAWPAGALWAAGRAAPGARRAAVPRVAVVWLAGALPALALIAHHLGHDTGTWRWLRRVEDPLSALAATLGAWGPVGPFAPHLGPLGALDAPAAAAGALWAALGVVAALALGRGGPRRAITAPATASAGIVAALIAAGLAVPLMLPGRYDVIALPLLLVAAAVAAGQATAIARSARILAIAVVVAWCGAGAATAARWWSLPRPRPHHAAAVYLRRHAVQTTVCTHLSCPPLALALAPQDLAAPQAWPPALARHPCWIDPNLRESQAGLAADATNFAATLDPRGRIAIVSPLDDAGRARAWRTSLPLVQALRARGWQVVDQHGSDGIGVLVLDPAGVPPQVLPPQVP